jgi:hypothetical protein
MAWESALDSVIEVAIALVGFSGIVAAVGRRGAGHWSPLDQLLLRVLLTAAGAALAFAFLPYLLIDIMDPSLVWRICSGVHATFMFGIMLYRFREVSVLGETEAVGKRATVFMFVGSSMAFIVSVSNALWFASSSLYVAAIFWHVISAFLTFVALLLDAWREPPDATPPRPDNSPG